MERILNFSVVSMLCSIVCIVIVCCGYVSDLLGYTWLATGLLGLLSGLVIVVYELTMWVKRTYRRIHRNRWCKRINRELDYISDEAVRIKNEIKAFIDIRNPIFGIFTSDEYDALRDERQSYIDESKRIIDECVRVYDRINACEAETMRYYDGYSSEEQRKRFEDNFSRLREVVSLLCNTINEAVMPSTTTTIVA